MILMKYSFKYQMLIQSIGFKHSKLYFLEEKFGYSRCHLEVGRMGARKPLVVHAVWDDKAKVWVATSEDVPGLATEAPSWDKLIPKLKRMIPELLDANGYADGDDDVRFKVLGEVNEVAHREAA